MHESRDYNTIRSIVYLIPALILIMAVRVGTSAFFISYRVGIASETLFRAAGGLTLAAHFLEYVLAVACFVCFFRLAETNIWVDYASTMFLSYMLSGVAVRVVEWVAYRLDPSGVAEAGFLVAGELPVIFIFLGVAFFINGMKGIYPEIRENSEKQVKSCVRARGHWLLGGVLLIAAELLLEIFILHLAVRDTMLIRWIAFLLVLIYLLASIPLTLRLQHFCYEYYMFCYNRGR